MPAVCRLRQVKTVSPPASQAMARYFLSYHKTRTRSDLQTWARRRRSGMRRVGSRSVVWFISNERRETARSARLSPVPKGFGGKAASPRLMDLVRSDDYCPAIHIPGPAAFALETRPMAEDHFGSRLWACKEVSHQPAERAAKSPLTCRSRRTVGIPLAREVLLKCRSRHMIGIPSPAKVY